MAAIIIVCSEIMTDKKFCHCQHNPSPARIKVYKHICMYLLNMFLLSCFLYTIKQTNLYYVFIIDQTLLILTHTIT